MFIFFYLYLTLSDCFSFPLYLPFILYTFLAKQHLENVLLDSDLLLILLRELSLSVLELSNDLEIAKAVTALEPELQLPFDSNTKSIHILHCQRLNCQREIFEIYLSCPLCGYLCLNCASGGGSPDVGGCVEFHSQHEMRNVPSRSQNKIQKKNQSSIDRGVKYQILEHGVQSPEQIHDDGNVPYEMNDSLLIEGTDQNISPGPLQTSRNIINDLFLSDHEFAISVLDEKKDDSNLIKESTLHQNGVDIQNRNNSTIGKTKIFCPTRQGIVDLSDVYHIHAQGSKILMKSTLKDIQNSVKKMADLIIFLRPDLCSVVIDALGKCP